MAPRRRPLGTVPPSLAILAITAVTTTVWLDAARAPSGQIPSSRLVYARGQTVVPAYEGWEPNTDGSFSLVFGYMNRNLDEHLDIPIGPNNILEPAGPDRGQPTHFLPRRNRFVFRVRVPADFGDQQVVWSLTSRGRTERAYATLRPEYVLDGIIVMRDTGFFGQWGDSRENQAPVVRVEGDLERSVGVGEPLMLEAYARDDGIPQPRAAPLQMPARFTAIGLRVAWFVYRGRGAAVTFDPAPFKVYPDYRSNSPWTPGWMPPPVPDDGRFPVTVRFDEPGTYVLRVMAHDGGFDATQDVTVTVHEAAG